MALSVRTRRRAALTRLAALAGAAWMPAWPGTLFAQTARPAGGESLPVKRRALVLGNSSYRPDRQAIPSSRKNAVDVGDALAKLGFEVRREVDVSEHAMRALVAEFFAQVRADQASRPLAVFYYSGHGIQYRTANRSQTDNFVVPSDVGLDQRVDGIVRGCINIDQDVINQAPLPNDGAAILIFDACRTDPSKGRNDPTGSFNQVNPPPGTVIAYSTAAGKYAIAPKSPDENSIYTRFLVQELHKANADISIKDFLDTVKFEVKRYMENHEEEFLRRHAQDPEVAANLKLPMSLALERVVPVVVDDSEQRAWAAIEQAIVPPERIKLLKDFIANFKTSRFLQAAQVQLERASITEVATQRNRVQIDTTIDNERFRDDQKKAMDGDKDAAYRLALMYKEGTSGAPRDEGKMVQWLRHAAELKNGIACYELYQFYRDKGLDRLAVRYERLAVEHGYTLPLRLSGYR